MRPNNFCLSLIAALICVILASPARAQEFDKLKFSRRDNDVITLSGMFNKSRAVSPGEMIFAYLRTLNDGQMESLFQYNFDGRTGDKTFDLRQIEWHFGKREEKKISVYFDPDAPLPVKAMSVYLQVGAGCAAGEVPKIAMIKLTGNELETQVLLPDCLRK